MRYLPIIGVIVIIELCFILGLYLVRRRVKDSVDVDHRRKIEDRTLLMTWMSLYMFILVMMVFLMKIT